MNRIVPTPLLSAGLFALWLLLARTFSPGQVLLGAIVAIAMPLLMQRLRPRSKPVRKPLVMMRLILLVGGDVIRSGIEVGHGVLTVDRREPRGKFVKVPLDLRDEHALAALAMITAVIPGTVWSELAPDRSAVLLHVFDLKGSEEADFIRRFKSRYEHALKEIFE